MALTTGISRTYGIGVGEFNLFDPVRAGANRKAATPPCGGSSTTLRESGAMTRPSISTRHRSGSRKGNCSPLAAPYVPGRSTKVGEITLAESATAKVSER